ncbi:hypothetical protein STENM36S_00683 [Streptomyces tendae]
MPGAKTAVAWLASVAPDPESCRRDGSATLRRRAAARGQGLGRAHPPSRLGYPTLDVLSRVLDQPGPVLADFGDVRTGGSSVPAGTAARWVGTGIRTAGLGTWIVVPYPGGLSSGDLRLIPPDGTGTLTDPSLLELAMHEAAAALAAEESGG